MGYPAQLTQNCGSATPMTMTVTVPPRPVCTNSRPPKPGSCAYVAVRSRNSGYAPSARSSMAKNTASGLA